MFFIWNKSDIIPHVSYCKIIPNANLIYILKEFCKNNIGGFKQPQKIVIINLLDDLDDIPKGPTKKILYRELKKYYMENLSDN